MAFSLLQASQLSGPAPKAMTKNRPPMMAMRSRLAPNADLATVGQPSSLLCHLGNAAWRLGRTLEFDPATRSFKNDKEANKYITRPEYRKPWLLPKIEEV